MVSIQQATAVLEAFIAKDDRRMWSLWASLPDGLNSTLVSRAMHRAMGDGHSARAVGRRLNEAYVDLYLAELEKHPRWPETIVAKMVPNEQLGEMFRKMRLLQNARGLAMERIRPFAKDQYFVHALTAMLIGADLEQHFLYRVVAILLEAGTDDAVDALLPFFDKVIVEQGEQLTHLRRMVRALKQPKAAVQPLVAKVEEVAGARAGVLAMPVIRAGIGLPERKRPLVFTWAAECTQAKRVLYVKLSVDFQTDPWFSVSFLEQVGSDIFTRGSFTSRGTDVDELGLEPLEFLELPRWLRRTQVTLGGDWVLGEVRSKTDREIISAWLLG